MSTSALGFGFDVKALVTGLMTIESAPKTMLLAQQARFQKQADALSLLNAEMANIGTMARAFDAANEWQPLKTTSSSTSVATTSTSGSITGSLSFSVTALASKQKIYSSSTVAATTTNVAAPGHLLLAAGVSAQGFQTLEADATLALGSHTVEVTQASAAAAKAGDSPLAASTVIDGTNNGLDITINGQAHSLTIADGTYTAQELADALGAALTAAGGTATDLAAPIGDNGALALKTQTEGSAANIQVTGGSAMAALRLSADGSPISGTDGKVKVDGTETVVTSAKAGTAVSLAGTVGAIDATLAGGLRLGTNTVKNVDLGDGSLGAVVSAINGANGTVAASAVKVGTDAYRLQIESKITGVAGRLAIDTSTFTGVSGFASLSAGEDASIQIQGTTPYNVTSSSNTFTDVLPGTTFTLLAPTVETVTITATRDSSALAGRVKAMVDAANTAMTDIKSKTSYSSAAGAGVLLGNSGLQRFQMALNVALTDPVVASSLKTAGAAGVSLTKDGTMAFDQAKFLAAYEADPAAVERLFVTAPDDVNPSIGQRLQTVVKDATDVVTGYITTSAQSRKDTVTRLTGQIRSFDDRMVYREKALQRQYNAINTALTGLQQQTKAVTGALGGLTLYA